MGIDNQEQHEEEIETVQDDNVVEDLESSESEQEAPAEEQWEPNYKFKVMDQEHEMDEFIRPIVNKDNYDKVKELYEKAYGLDFVKNKYTSVKEEYDNFKNTEYNKVAQEYDKYNKAFNYLNTSIANKDYENLMSSLGINKQEIIQLAIKYAQYENLTPEQKHEYDSNLQAKQRLYELEEREKFYEQQHQTQMVQAYTAELNNILTAPTTQEIVSNYDAQTQPGAFRQLVVQMGQNAWAQGKVISVQEAYNRALAYVPKTYHQPSQVTQPAVSKPATPKPSLPSLKAGGSSPVTKPITNMEDLMKKRAALLEQE